MMYLRKASVVVLVAVFMATSARAQDWAVHADVAESCNCDITCPCNLGSRHTHDYCEGSRLIEIREGHIFTQYKSIETSHRGDDKAFSYSGTTGFTSKMEVSGKN